MGRKLLAVLAVVAIGFLSVGCGERTTFPVAATPVPIPTSLPTAVTSPAATDTAIPLVPDDAPTPPPTRATTPALTPVPTPLPTHAVTPAAALAPPPLRPLTVARAFKELDFRGLTNLVQPAAGDDRLFATEQSGRVLAFANNEDTNESEVFLDRRGQVNDSGSEEGLLGLAFDPRFQDNGYLYVYYSASAPRRSVVSRFGLGDDGRRADPDSELVIMEIEQPFRNHNGGQLAFGPDGFLYIGLGDGGSAGDPMGHGRNASTLLGSILRIDVSAANVASPYTIPSDNPLLGDVDARGEIWAYGLRNPWRFTFDRETGELWAGDVGQNSLEEVDLVERGGDYGWNTLEGTRCFSPRASCDPGGTVLPVWEYPTGEACSVIGGYVYRGDRIPSLYGAYVFGDYCSGQIWALRYDGQKVTEFLLLADTGLRIASFGEARDGELFVLSQNSGIYRLDP